MDLVPGLVSRFWFTPTQTGRFEIMCAEFCGVAHFNMRGHIVVEPADRFVAWLDAQPTYAQSLVKTGAPAADVLVAQGRALAQSRGCLACHTLDGRPGVGPTWRGLYGKTETLVGGAKVAVDDAYLRRSIVEPNVQVVQGFAPVMPPSSLNDQEMDALIAFIKDAAAAAPAK
jgi:cytochrome c oxidase subunit 2